MMSLKTHNVFDYIIAVVLVLAPFLFGFSDIDAARNTFLILGFGLAAYSLITKYYYCIARIIPLGVHMIFDVSAGLVVLIAPYIFDYRESLTTLQFAVHVVMGIGAIGLVAVTRTRSEGAKTVEEKRETLPHSYNRNRPHHA
jgi:DNA integrity scanning protein DisA with diadenylate cyclase activity